MNPLNKVTFLNGVLLLISVLAYPKMSLPQGLMDRSSATPGPLVEFSRKVKKKTKTDRQ